MLADVGRLGKTTDRGLKKKHDLILPLLFLKISWNREDFAIFWKTRTSSCQYTFAIKIDNGQILNAMIPEKIFSSNNKWKVIKSRTQREKDINSRKTRMYIKWKLKMWDTEIR